MAKNTAPANNTVNNGIETAIKAFGKRDKSKASLGKGICDIPSGNYRFKEDAGITASGMRKVKYTNTATLEDVTFYNPDGYKELWNATETELKPELSFGFDAEKKKVTLGATAPALI